MPEEAGWHERIELRLEGGGTLPGASEVVDIKHKIISCTVARRKDLAQVRGQLQVFVYYRFAGMRKVRGQGVEVPWHAEVIVPDTVHGPLNSEVVDIRHEQSFDPQTEHLNHVMFITFNVWAGERSSAKSVAPSSAPEPSADQIPEWAREAADELMRSQNPAAGNTPSWLRDTPTPEHDFGQSQGSFTRAGQPYDGPQPDWPHVISFDLVEKTLEGEPLEREISSTAADKNESPKAKEETSMSDLAADINGAVQPNSQSESAEPTIEVADQPLAQVEHTLETESRENCTIASPSAEAVKTIEPESHAEKEEPKPEKQGAPEEIVWRRFPKTELPKL